MDDESFDSFIKRKVREYTPEGYNPNAFAPLKSRLNSQTASFYTRYRMEILVGSSLAIILLSMFFGRGLNDNADARLIYQRLRSNEDLINELRNEIRELKNAKINTNVADSLYYDQHLQLNSKILSLETTLRQALSHRNSETLMGPPGVDDSTEIYSNFSDYDSIMGMNLRITPREASRSSVRATRNAESFNYQSNNVSAKTIHELEKHYYPGLGIEIGPAFELSRGSFENASGSINANFGILANLIVSPSLSIEAGGKYVYRDYTYEGDALENGYLPGTDPSLGELATAEIDTWLIEIPTNLKYRYPISSKAHWLIGLGYSSFFVTEQSFDYSYLYNNSTDIFLNKVYETNTVKFYPGTLNFSFGIDHKIKKQKIEASLIFSKGLSEFGSEKSKANYFGLRSVFWMRVK